MKLTAKDRLTIVMLCRGLRPAQICERLGITRHAWTNRRRQVLRKLGVSNDAQIGALAERLQLVPVCERNRIEDRREERLDARRSSGGATLRQFMAGVR